MKNGDRMLNWLLTQKDPSADVIEEVEGKELLELIEVAEHLAVFFCMIFFLIYYFSILIKYVNYLYIIFYSKRDCLKFIIYLSINIHNKNYFPN